MLGEAALIDQNNYWLMIIFICTKELAVASAASRSAADKGNIVRAFARTRTPTIIIKVTLRNRQEACRENWN
ncbi:MAG: hypothetical protein JSR27_03880 [Proteobacteria bacterium]|nr:hypothetical protein [Pseudomonadota bacterium]